MTAITLHAPSHPGRLTLATGALAVAMFAAGVVSHATVVPPTVGVAPVNAVTRSVSPLPVEYYLVGDEEHAGRVSSLFEAVNRTRLTKGEPTLRVAVVDPAMDLTSFLRLVAPEDRGAGIILRDLRSTCGVCAADEPE